jgi:integrase
MSRIGSRVLTVKQVEAEQRVGYYADGQAAGLYLQVANGVRGVVRSWIFRYTSPTTKTRREVGLGATTIRKLTDARSKAAEFRLMVLNGEDPKDIRDSSLAAAIATKAKQITFAQAVEDCIKAKAPEWRNAKHVQQWTNTLTTYALPLLGKQPVNAITTELVYEVLAPIWQTKTETATRLRQRIEVVLDWCKARGYCSGDNPARLKGALGELLPKSKKIKKVEHHAAVPYVLAHDFLSALRAQVGTASLALELMMLTATRTGEVVGARWDEFDLGSGVWVIPADRMKAEREHRVPLSKRVLDILEIVGQNKQNEYVFPGHSIAKNSHLSTGAFLAVMKKMPDFKQYTPHGLRSTFRDWAAETTSYSNETLELALAHTIKNQAEAAYRRGDQLEKRLKLMQQWQQYVETPASTATITPLRRKSTT